MYRRVLVFIEPHKNRYMTDFRCKYNYYFSFIAYPEDNFSKNLTFCLGTKFANM